MTRWGARIAVASRGRTEAVRCAGRPRCRRSGMDDLHPWRVGQDLRLLGIGIALRIFAVPERGLAERVSGRKDDCACQHKRKASKLAGITASLGANRHAAILSEFL